MNRTMQGFTISIIIGSVILLIVLCGIIAWTTCKSFIWRKAESPKLWLLFIIAFLQILPGVITVFAVKGINNNPIIALGSGLVVLIISGCFWIKIFLKVSWKQTLRLWSYAAVMQLILVPVCAAALTIAWLMLTFTLFPPLL
jgi:hypothetical protein